MSLAIATWGSPMSYSITSDTLISTHIASRAEHGSKLFRAGDWLGAWTGTVVAAQRFVRAFRPGDHAEADDAILAAWEAALTGCPAPEANCWRSADVDVLLVGPPGVVKLSATGAILRPMMRVDGQIVGVVGCADEYVVGWMDRHDGKVGPCEAGEVIRLASRHYPGVGARTEGASRTENGFEGVTEGKRTLVPFVGGSGL